MLLSEKEKRNHAYSQFVSNENDLIGMIGYSLYKKAKIDYIENYFSNYSIYPNDVQLKDFQLQQCGKTNVSSHKKYTENLMNSFIHKYKVKLQILKKQRMIFHYLDAHAGNCVANSVGVW